MGSGRPDTMTVLRDAESWISCEVDLPPKPISFLEPVHRCIGGGLRALGRGHSSPREHWRCFGNQAALAQPVILQIAAAVFDCAAVLDVWRP
jgi:hypothetical protein